MKLRSVRGTHDIFGEEINKFNFISNIVSKNANLKAYKEIQTPIFEFTDLFAKPLGEHSDVVLKEMYSFEDRNNEYSDEFKGIVSVGCFISFLLFFFTW